MKLTLNKYLLFYDIYERHKKIGSLINNGETVLDVGGAINHLSQFCNPGKIITANLVGSEDSDVNIKKNKLPFEDNSFDVVCAIDVLEHLPSTKRKRFIEEMSRIAREKLILSFPIGTLNHKEYEIKTSKWLQSKKIDLTYLREHIKYGLPTKEEITDLTKNSKFNIVYSGNIVINNFLFHLFMFDPQVKLVRRLVYGLKLMFNFLTNPIFYMLLSTKKYSSSVNRAYLILKKV